MFVSIRNDGNLESILRRVTNGQTHTVHRNRAFVHRDVTALCHFLVKRISESKIPAPFGILYIHTFGSLIHMSLHNMTVQPPVHHHAAFHIHFISHFQQADVGTLYRFFHGGNRVRSIL